LSQKNPKISPEFLFIFSLDKTKNVPENITFFSPDKIKFVPDKINVLQKYTPTNGISFPNTKIKIK
jgi:hypothetical protein